MMHPCFRVPQHSDWHWDPAKNHQSRLVSQYLTSATIDIQTHPGLAAHGKSDASTAHFHRPLQAYIHTLASAGLLTDHLAEWPNCYSSVITCRATRPMLIRIEASSGIPITRQIVDQIRTQCASGTLAAGDRLWRPRTRPPACRPAEHHSSRYERLTAEGILELRHGEGTFVTDFATGKHLRREKAQLQEDAERLVRRGVALGLTAREIRALLDEAIERNAKELPTGGGNP